MNKLITAMTLGTIFVGTPIIVSGCTCKNAIPVLVQSQNMITDAQVAISRVESILRLVPNLNANTKIKLEAAIVQAYESLQNATKIVNQMKSDCLNPNYPEIFKEFNAAWNVIRQILPTLITILSAKGEHLSTIPDPIVYTIK